MTITFLSDPIGVSKGVVASVRQFSRQTEREMLLVTARSFVCRLLAALDGKQGWTASWKHDTGHGLLIVAAPFTSERTMYTLDLRVVPFNMLTLAFSD